MTGFLLAVPGACQEGNFVNMEAIGEMNCPDTAIRRHINTDSSSSVSVAPGPLHVGEYLLWAVSNKVAADLADLRVTSAEIALANPNPSSIQNTAHISPVHQQPPTFSLRIHINAQVKN